MVAKESKIPKIKKKIGSFLTKEDGKISKDALVKAGLTAAIGAGLASSALAVCNHSPGDNYYESSGSTLTVDFDETSGELTGSHSHHSDHCSHSSHSSHGSHGSHGQW